MHNNKGIIKLNCGETARSKYFCQKNISWNGKCSRYSVKFKKDMLENECYIGCHSDFVIYAGT